MGDQDEGLLETEITARELPLTSGKKIKKIRGRDFPGGPVAKQGPGVQSLVRELDPTYHS